ncbi:MAG: sugar phosphate nucleotidyltransferase [Bacteroidales bacterium]|nr:sugar phosphate nucleotidyltransferase [Bacteroidales bacterium]
MKVMLFAAGLGTRLRPLTDTLPKALVPIEGRPLLDITLQRLKDAGATEVVVNVHHFGEQIIEYLQNHDYGIPVRISDEREQLLDTGGGLKAALPLFVQDEAPILIHNVDILSNAHLSDFYQAQPQADVLLLVSERPTQRYLLFNEEGRMVGWTNRATGEVRSPYPDLRPEACKQLAFAGIHRVHPRIARCMEGQSSRFPIMNFYIEHCHLLDIRAYQQEGLQLLDVGKQDTLLAAANFLRTQ